MVSPSRHSQCCWSTLGNSAGLQQPPRSSRCTCQTLVAKPNPQISITPTPAPDNHGTQNSEENLVIDGAEQQEVLQEPRVRPVHGIAVLQRRFVIPCSVTLPRDLEARALVNWNPPKPRRVNNPTTKMKISAQSNHGTARWISINHQRGEEKARGSWSTRTKRTFEGVEPEGFDHRAQLLLLARGERAMVAHRAVLLHGGGATASASAAHREHRRKASPTIGEPKVKKNKNLTRATAPRGLELSRTSRGGGWTLSGDIAFSPSFFFPFFFGCVVAFVGIGKACDAVSVRRRWVWESGRWAEHTGTPVLRATCVATIGGDPDRRIGFRWSRRFLDGRDWAVCGWAGLGDDSSGQVIAVEPINGTTSPFLAFSPYSEVSTTDKSETQRPSQRSTSWVLAWESTSCLRNWEAVDCTSCMRIREAVFDFCSVSIVKLIVFLVLSRSCFYAKYESVVPLLLPCPFSNTPKFLSIVWNWISSSWLINTCKITIRYVKNGSNDVSMFTFEISAP